MSLTIRFELQSMEETLPDEKIQEVMERIRTHLEGHFKAELR